MTFRNLLPLLITCLALFSCTTKYRKALKYGKVSQDHFNETVPIEVINQLTIIPVKIKGHTYRFLFDTGAPFSISKELQNRIQYKQLNQATLTDSDNSKSSLDIVQVDSISIGSITFLNQTAFTASFKNNIILKCLNIDGIVGSNLMRHCNWTIDMQNEVLNLSKGYLHHKQEGFITIPFNTDKQYDIILDLAIGNTLLKNVKLDYGSNGSLSISDKAFDILKTKEFLQTLSIKGYSQSGLFGTRKPLNSELTQVDSIWIGRFPLNQILIESGKSGLLGGKILINYIVKINWENQTISFSKHLNQYKFTSNFGIRIGFTDKVIIQSIYENSPAEQMGLKPNMEILGIDHLDFTKQHNLCDYIDYFQKERVEINLVYKTLNGTIHSIILTKKSPFNKVTSVLPH